MARYRPDAFPKGPRTRKTPVRGNISPPCIQIQLILARYACYVSEKPRKAPLGNTPREHLAAKGRFRRPKPPDHARRTNLATLRWPCPCAGAPARATASQDRLSTAWPLRRGAYPPSASPIPATCQCLSPANTRRSLHPLQPGTSRRWASAAIIRLMAYSPAKPRGAADCVISTGRPTTECCAELGLDSRTVSKWAQNLRRRPQARPVLRQRCQKRPSKGRVPLDGTIGAPSGTPIPHTLPLRKNEAAKPGKNFAKRVIFTPRTRFRRLSGEICSKRVPRLLLSARFEYVSQSSWHRPANFAYIWAKSRPIGAETPFEKQKCTRMSKSEGMWHSSAPSNAACLATAGKTNL